MRQRMGIRIVAMLSVFAIVATFPITGFGEIPQHVSYQGSLTDDVGNPLDGEYVMVLAIYDISAGGTPLWWEEQTVTVANGIYNVQIGQDPTGNPFPADLFNGQRWLGVVVGADAEMEPRQSLTSAPYAMRAEVADTVVEESVGTVHLSDNAVTSDKMSDDAVTSAKIVDGSVTAADIYDGSGSGLDADTLDGLNSGSFMSAGTDLWVNATGDNMTGDLSIVGGNISIANNEASGDGYGLYTELTGSLSGNATGVYAKANVINNASSGDTYGGYFIADDDRPNGLSYGVIGEATGANNERYGVYGRAIYSGDGEPNIGIVAEAASSDYYAYGFYANVDLTTSGSHGAFGADINVDASSSSNGHLYGVNSDVTHNGAYGNTYGFRTTVQPSDNGSTYGIYASVNSTGTTGLAYAGYFDGRVDVTGQLVKGGGAFKIDHPLDPENKYLQHSFVESPDMKNVYDGVVVIDPSGEAWVDLPEYFEALNRDFCYQLTCIGGFAQVYIVEEISGNRFKISGGIPGLKVSWQVTGIRKDAWAEANRIQVEVEKDGTEQGFYLHPEAFGLDETRSVKFARRPEMLQEQFDAE